MKKIVLFFAVLISLQATAQQVTKVSLQASGLTCSMCSNAINKALKSLAFVDRIDANIKNSSFDIYFKPDMDIDFEKIKKKVEDAGFSVASFSAIIHFNAVKMLDDYCMLVGETAFQIINTKELLLNGDKQVRILDKGFVPAKEFKKNISLFTKQQCYNRVGQKLARVYHITI